MANTATGLDPNSFITSAESLLMVAPTSIRVVNAFKLRFSHKMNATRMLVLFGGKMMLFMFSILAYLCTG